MGKIYDKLQHQLKENKFSEDAKDCLLIYEKLKEINNGSVWSSQWDILTTISGWIGDTHPKTMAIKPTKLGYELLKSIKYKNQNISS